MAHMRRVTCDQCGADIDDEATSIEVTYPAIDDDGDLYAHDADFCGWSCLATWAVSTGIDAERA